MHSCSSAHGHVRLIAPSVGRGRFTCLGCWPTSFEQARKSLKSSHAWNAGDSEAEKCGRENGKIGRRALYLITALIVGIDRSS